MNDGHGEQHESNRHLTTRDDSLSAMFRLISDWRTIHLDGGVKPTRGEGRCDCLSFPRREVSQNRDHEMSLELESQRISSAIVN